MKVHPEHQAIFTKELWRGRKINEDEQSVMICTREQQLQVPLHKQTLLTMKTVLTMKHLENSEADHKRRTWEKVTTLDYESFKDNNEKVWFYTGLTNWSLLLNVFQFVQPFVHTYMYCRSSLPAFQQVVMMLMRIHLVCATVIDVCHRYWCSISNIETLDCVTRERTSS